MRQFFGVSGPRRWASKVSLRFADARVVGEVLPQNYILSQNLSLQVLVPKSQILNSQVLGLSVKMNTKLSVPWTDLCRALHNQPHCR